MRNRSEVSCIHNYSPANFFLFSALRGLSTATTTTRNHLRMLKHYLKNASSKSNSLLSKNLIQVNFHNILVFFLSLKINSRTLFNIRTAYPYKVGTFVLWTQKRAANRTPSRLKRFAERKRTTNQFSAVSPSRLRCPTWKQTES
jgi:hypothetical protein